MGRIMNNVTKMELYKVLSKPQVYIIFVVGLIIQSIMARQMRTTMFNGYHKSVYENYMNEMEGEYSIEKKENRTKKICEERIKFCKSTKIDWEKMVSYGNIEYITRINTGGRFHGKRNDCNAVGRRPGKPTRRTYRESCQTGGGIWRKISDYRFSVE